MDNSTVRILLAAHNGETYLAAQLDSLLSQDYPHIQIILSDDNSSDATVDILARYASEYPDKITHYQSGKIFGSAQKHFMHLLAVFRDAPYIMFCDQDDLWHPDKVSKSVRHLRSIAAEHEPALVHTDLQVVDGDLTLINPSFCCHSALDGNRLALHQLLVQNVVTGCTIILNRSLAELACSVSFTDAILMHDWWLALLASACGKISFLNESTIDYRQHGNNAVGAKNVRSFSYVTARLKSNSMRAALRKTADQAAAFRKAFGGRLTPEQKRLLDAFISTRSSNIFRRDYVYLKYRLLKSGILRKIAQLLGL